MPTALLDAGMYTSSLGGCIHPYDVPRQSFDMCNVINRLS